MRTYWVIVERDGRRTTTFRQETEDMPAAIEFSQDEHRRVYGTRGEAVAAGLLR